jgi:DNA polymerase V
MPRGGKRPGAGRPKGTGKYGEPTVPVRVPVSLAGEISNWVRGGGRGIPLYGASVRAGLATAADDFIEGRVDLHDYVVKHPDATFMVRVQGPSMRDANIQDGDLLVVDRSLPAMDGKVVVAAIDGDLTVKTLRRGKKGVELHPANPDFSVIHVSPEQAFEILGVVTTVVHDV